MDPGELLGQLLQGSDAAGERHEGVGALEHEPLAFMHSGHDEAFLDSGQQSLSADEEIGDYSGDPAAICENRACDGAHKACRAPSVDEANSGSRHHLAKLTCGGFMAGVGADRGAAVDANIAHEARSSLARSVFR